MSTVTAGWREQLAWWAEHNKRMTQGKAMETLEFKFKLPSGKIVHCDVSYSDKNYSVAIALDECKDIVATLYELAGFGPQLDLDARERVEQALAESRSDRRNAGPDEHEEGNFSA